MSGRFYKRPRLVVRATSESDVVNTLRIAREVGANEGLFICPEGAACFVALKLLRLAGKIASGERVVVFNTGSGIKYLEAYDRG